MKSKVPSYYGADTKSYMRARSLRKDQTSAEWLFWQMVRNRKVLGYKFRRQHPIGGYFTDFYCHEANLVIELDGNIHEIADVKSRDEFREANIKGQGLVVMRFKNDDIFKNAQIVIGEIEKYFKSNSFKP